MDMEIKTIMVMHEIQQRPREDLRAQHLAEAAFIPRPAKPNWVQRTHAACGNALVRFGAWVQPITPLQRFADDGPVVELGPCETSRAQTRSGGFS